MNIDETAHPEAFRYVLEAETEADAVAKGRAQFTEQNGREPAARAIIDVESLD
jgi:Xaa-Pro aminopeptidase